MRTRTLSEIAEAQRTREQIASHEYRLKHWKPNAVWLGAWPAGVVCPFCQADHCEIDQHRCQ